MRGDELGVGGVVVGREVELDPVGVITPRHKAILGREGRDEDAGEAYSIRAEASPRGRQRDAHTSPHEIASIWRDA